MLETQVLIICPNSKVLRETSLGMMEERNTSPPRLARPRPGIHLRLIGLALVGSEYDVVIVLPWEFTAKDSDTRFTRCREWLDHMKCRLRPGGQWIEL